MGTGEQLCILTTQIGLIDHYGCGVYLRQMVRD